MLHKINIVLGFIFGLYAIFWVAGLLIGLFVRGFCVTSGVCQ